MKTSLDTANNTLSLKGSGTPSDAASTHVHMHVSNVYDESNEAFVYDSKGSEEAVVKYRPYDAVLMDFM